MFRKLFVLLVLVTVNPVMAGDTSRFNILYGELLDQYWRPMETINGIETTVFDYAAMQSEAGPLIEEISETLVDIDPEIISNDNEAKAFWINVYNFAAIRLVVRSYPVDSITSFKVSLIKHPWSKKSIQVAGRWYSLSGIEKEVLLKRYNDPRIIFAVSCAAVSCPDRRPEVFDGARLENQLDDLIRNFFLNPKKGLSLNRETNTLTLAWIIKKDSHLFQDDEEKIAGFVMPYLDKEQRDWLALHQIRIDYFRHDWTLNDLAQADDR